MEICIVENSEMGWQMGRGVGLLSVDLGMRASGRMMFIMERERKLFRMGLFTRDHIRWG